MADPTTTLRTTLRENTDLAQQTSQNKTHIDELEEFQKVHKMLPLTMRKDMLDAFTTIPTHLGAGRVLSASERSAIISTCAQHSIRDPQIVDAVNKMRTSVGGMADSQQKSKSGVLLPTHHPMLVRSSTLKSPPAFAIQHCFPFTMNELLTLGG